MLGDKAVRHPHDPIEGSDNSQSSMATHMHLQLFAFAGVHCRTLGLLANVFFHYYNSIAPTCSKSRRAGAERCRLVASPRSSSYRMCGTANTRPCFFGKDSSRGPQLCLRRRAKIDRS
jgi:hypothetical protein